MLKYSTGESCKKWITKSEKEKHIHSTKKKYFDYIFFRAFAIEETFEKRNTFGGVNNLLCELSQSIINEFFNVNYHPSGY